MMKFLTSALTIAFVVLKLLGKIDWSWLACFVPTLIYVAVWLLFWCAVIPIMDKIDPMWRWRR